MKHHLTFQEMPQFFDLTEEHKSYLSAQQLRAQLELSRIWASQTRASGTRATHLSCPESSSPMGLVVAFGLSWFSISYSWKKKMGFGGLNHFDPVKV